MFFVAYSSVILSGLVNRLEEILSEFQGLQITQPSDLAKGEAWLDAKGKGIQVKDLARQECVSPTHIYDLMVLARLPDEAKTIVRMHRLSHSQVKPYLKLPITQLKKKLRALTGEVGQRK